MNARLAAFTKVGCFHPEFVDAMVTECRKEERESHSQIEACQHPTLSDDDVTLVYTTVLAEAGGTPGCMTPKGRKGQSNDV